MRRLSEIREPRWNWSDFCYSAGKIRERVEDFLFTSWFLPILYISCIALLIGGYILFMGWGLK